MITRFGVLAIGLVISGCAASGKSASTAPNPPPAQEPRASADASGSEKKNTTKEDKAKAEKEKADRAIKRAKLMRDLQIAREEVAKVQASMQDQEASSKENLEKAASERELVARRLREFEEKHVPVRLDRSRLDLQGTRDYVKESEEELAQLEMMYAEADLADKTREIVIERAKRRLERARRSLDIQTRDSENLERATIPVEREDLRLQLMQKDQALEQARRQAAADARAKRIELMRAQSEVERILAEQEQLEREEKDATP